MRGTAFTKRNVRRMRGRRCPTRRQRVALRRAAVRRYAALENTP